MMKKSRFDLTQFHPGQIWEVAGSCLEIALVGKTLVHYKRYKGKSKGVPTALAAKKTLENYLRENNAILVQE